MIDIENRFTNFSIKRILQKNGYEIWFMKNEYLVSCKDPRFGKFFKELKDAMAFLEEKLKNNENE